MRRERIIAASLLGLTALTSSLAHAAEESASPPAQPAASAQKQYDEHYIDFTDGFVVVDGHTGAQVWNLSLPYEGKYRQPLDGDAFYAKVGRPDLAQTYRVRMTNKVVLFVAGAAVTLAGPTYALWSLNSPSSCRQMTSVGCVDRDFTPAWVGLGMMAAGGLTMLIGGAIDPNPVELPERRRLADEYNQKLKRDLGLASSNEVAPSHPPVSVALGGFLLPGGGGLSLSLQL